MKRLVAGPFLGEFGWELMAWQAFARKAAKGYDEVVVCSRESNEALYRDFATKFIPHQIQGLKDCFEVLNVDRQSLRNLDQYLRGLGGDRLTPTQLIPIEHQHFVPFGSKDRGKRLGYNFDIVCHARKPIGKRPGHAWPPNHWNELIKRLEPLRVAAVGLEAYCPDGAVDLRKASLQDSMDAMAATNLVIGPSSGPMHLASLCRVEHLVWTDNKVNQSIGATNRVRYETLWNPLKTPVTVLDQAGWIPPVELIYRAISERAQQWPSKPSAK